MNFSLLFSARAALRFAALSLLILSSNMLYSAVASAAQNDDAERIALIVNQVNYTDSPRLLPLKGTDNEADLIKKALIQDGFTVQSARDLTEKGLEAAFNVFRHTLDDHPGAIGFVYFTGHGAPATVDDEQDEYLLGIDAKLEKQSDIASYGIGVSYELKRLIAANPSLLIFVVDACRKKVEFGDGSKGSLKTAYLVKALPNVLVAYSTWDDDYAEEGKYAPILAEVLVQPGKSVSTVFSDVRDQVSEATNQKQIPYSDDKLKKRWCLVTCNTQKQAEAAKVEVGPTPWEIEQAVWSLAKDCPDYQAYTDRYPTGNFIGSAKAHLASLNCPVQNSAQIADAQVKQQAELEFKVGYDAYKKKDYSKAYSQLTLSCQGGNASGCARLATMYFYGFGVTKDLVKAKNLYEQGCNGGDALGCDSLGYFYLNGLGGAKDPLKAKVLFEQACNGGDALGCSNLGIMYEFGQGLTKDLSKARAFYEQGCKGGEATSCTNLGIFYSNGTGVPRDLLRAKALYEKGCNGDDASGCTNLGIVYEFGEGVAKDKAKAKGLYEKACNDGDAAGCTHLGYMYSNGVVVTKDPLKAKALYEKACNGGDASGCTNLGIVYELGQGLTKDLIKAKSLYEKGCNSGDAAGCTRLGVLYSNGIGVPKDLLKAKALYEQACSGGDGSGCTNLGIVYEFGEGVTRDKGKAKSLYEQACKRGDSRGCQRAKDLSSSVTVSSENIGNFDNQADGIIEKESNETRHWLSNEEGSFYRQSFDHR